MKGLFVDTGGWYACADRTDRAYAAARSARDAWLADGGLLVTTDYVLAETLTLLRRRLDVAATQDWWEHVQATPRLRWEWVGMERAEKAREMFFHHRDKDYSFTDCTSFVVMKELKLRHALTVDKHFTQAGFQILPTA
jgi:predicted nucleic acid-binding protein